MISLVTLRLLWPKPSAICIVLSGQDEQVGYTVWEEHKTGHDELDYCKHTTEKLMLLLFSEPVVWQLLRFITIKDNTLLCRGKNIERIFKKKNSSKNSVCLQHEDCTVVIQSHSGELILLPFEEPSHLNKEIGNTTERRKHNREHAIIWNNLVDTQHGNAWINIDPKVFFIP